MAVAPSDDASRVMSNLPGRVRVPKTAELVAAQLRRSIVRGELKQGDFLPPENVLQAQFGVSRPTLREAFRVLESEQLIQVRRGSQGGARVHSPDGDVAARFAGLLLQYRGATLADVFDAAAALETPLVGMLARRRTAADLKRLRAALELEVAAGDDLRLAAERAVAFHSLVIDLAGSATLQVLVEMLRHLIDTAIMRAQASDGRSPRQEDLAHRGARTHSKLIALLEARDAAGAEELWRRHLVETGRIIAQELQITTVLDLMV